MLVSVEHAVVTPECGDSGVPQAIGTAANKDAQGQIQSTYLLEVHAAIHSLVRECCYVVSLAHELAQQIQRVLL